MSKEGGNTGEEFVMPIEGDERFDYKKTEGVSDREAAEAFEGQVQHLNKQLESKGKELVALQRLASEGIAKPELVANKETEITQIETDLATAKRNAELAREAEAKASTANATEAVIPVDWEGAK